MSSIFISYSRKDISFAEKIVQALARNKLDTWIDWKSIPKGEDWEQEIYRGIEEAEAFLFLTSPDSVQSEMCNKEIAHAVKNNKRVIPIVIRDTDMKNFLYEVSKKEISRRNWIFCQDQQDTFSKAIKETLDTIHTDYEWLKYHTGLQIKALEWERSNREKSFLLHAKEVQDAELQLATKSSIEPYPTDLQREYVFKSRKATDRQRKITTTIAIAGVIVMALLAVFGFIQARLAEERANVARAGELATLADSLRASHFDLSLLFSVEAFLTADTPRTRSVLLDNTQTNLQLLQYLRGHRDPVTSVAFSPDGKLLAYGSYDSTVILWDTKTHQSVGQPLMGIDSVSSVAFSPNGKILASGGVYNTILLSDVETHGAISQLLKGDTGWILSLAFSPDGKMLASSSSDGTVLLWDVETRRAIGTLPKDATEWADAYYVAFSPDEEILASAGCGKRDSQGSCTQGKIILWDTETRQPIGQPLIGHTSAIRSIAFSPDGKLLASGSFDNTILLWNVETHQPIGSPLLGHTSEVVSLAFSPDGKILASGGGKVILLWDIETHQPRGQPFTGHIDPVSSVAFSPDGKLLASGSSNNTIGSGTGDNSVLLWNVQAYQPMGQVLTGHTGSVRSVVFSPDGKILASGSFDNAIAPSNRNQTILLWNGETHQSIVPSTIRHSDPVSSLAFSPDGKILASGGCRVNNQGYCPSFQEGKIILWDVMTGQPIGQPLLGHTDLITHIAFSPDGKLLASSSRDKTIILWDVRTHRPIGQPLKEHSDLVSDVAFSPDGKMFASSSTDYTIILWDVQTHQPIGQPLRHTGYVNSIAFSPDGKLLVSGTSANNILLWNVKTHKPVGQPLTGQNDWVEIVAFSPDGRTFASGSCGRRDNRGFCLQGKIILWDVETRQPIGRPLIGHTGEVWSITFSPDGKTLVSGSDDNTIMLWDVDPKSWVARSCERVGRNFSREEWANYFPNEEYHATCPQWPLEPEVLATPSPTPK